VENTGGELEEIFKGKDFSPDLGLMSFEEKQSL
jgi:hypothetical protein